MYVLIVLGPAKNRLCCDGMHTYKVPVRLRASFFRVSIPGYFQLVIYRFRRMSFLIAQSVGNRPTE